MLSKEVHGLLTKWVVDYLGVSNWVEDLWQTFSKQTSTNSKQFLRIENLTYFQLSNSVLRVSNMVILLRTSTSLLKVRNADEW